MKTNGKLKNNNNLRTELATENSGERIELD